MFEFSGRATRSTYWGTIFAGYLLWFLVGGLSKLIYPGLNEGGTDPAQIALGVGVIIGWLAWLLIVIAVSVRRLHDRGHSGWWVLVLNTGPGLLIVITIVAAHSATEAVATRTIPISILAGLLSVAIIAWGFVELGCLRGTVGPNRFGPDPLQQNTAPIAENPSPQPPGPPPVHHAPAAPVPKITAATTEDQLYEIVADELDRGTFNKGTWTRLLVQNDGNADKTKIGYIKHRVQALKELQRDSHVLGGGFAAAMVTIPAGSFMMGSPPGVGESNERPYHRVTELAPA